MSPAWILESIKAQEKLREEPFLHPSMVDRTAEAQSYAMKTFLFTKTRSPIDFPPNKDVRISPASNQSQDQINGSSEDDIVAVDLISSSLVSLVVPELVEKRPRDAEKGNFIDFLNSFNSYSDSESDVSEQEVKDSSLG